MKVEKELERYITKHYTEFKCEYADRKMVFKASSRTPTNPRIFNTVAIFLIASGFAMGVPLVLMGGTMWPVGLFFLIISPLLGFYLLGSKTILDLKEATAGQYIGSIKIKGFELRHVTKVMQVTIQNKGQYGGTRFELVSAANKKLTLCVLYDEAAADELGKLLGILITIAKKQQ